MDEKDKKDKNEDTRVKRDAPVGGPAGTRPSEEEWTESENIDRERTRDRGVPEFQGDRDRMRGTSKD